MPSATSTSPTPSSSSSLPSDYESLNREPSPQELLSSNLTSTSHAYDRNHGPIPHLDGSTHRITFSSTSTSNPFFIDQPARSLSLKDIRTLFPTTMLTCALQCAGNRRHTMRTKLKEVQGIDWANGAVMNCDWTGARLIDVLTHFLGRDAKSLLENNTDLKNLHLAFACNAVPVQDDSWYGSSIPLSRALDPESDILLAYEQNHAPLTPEHGYPIRVVIPGVAGARSVKWLDSITIQDHESRNFYQQHDYKILPPQAHDAQTAKDWWGKVDALMDMPINSVVFALGEGGIESIGEGDSGGSDRSGGNGSEQKDDIDQYGDGTVRRNKDGMIEVRGYALPGGDGGPVTSVEIRIDQGEWIEAELLYQNAHGVSNSDSNGHEKKDPNLSNGSNTRNSSNKWSWTLFRWKGPINLGKHTIWSRATDTAGNRQDSERSEWNLRGVAYNGYGEAEVEVL